MTEISEKSFQAVIVSALASEGAQGGVAQPRTGYGATSQGGYRSRPSKAYDEALCLIADDLCDFVILTQPQEWKRLSELYGDETRRRFLQRVRKEIERKGTLEVLRRGVKDSGVRVQLAYFRPHSGLNDELQRLYQANIFTIVRELQYREDKGGDRLDLVLFLNGLPLFTAELKNPLSAGGWTVEEAVRQYRKTRDPREPLFAFGRCLAHFAVDPDQVFVTTHLAGPKTRFLPFNKGYNGGAGNPSPPKTEGGYKTAYLWNEIWAKDSVLNLVQHFIQRIQKDTGGAKNGGAQLQLFPRYHQLDAVRRLVEHAREHGPGQQYLVQHSAGSGKSYTIGWLAHWLSVLHDRDDRRVFDSIIVITDRRVLDQQLQETVRQLEQTLGVVENIDTTSKQLQQALEEGKTIIVTTLQKFPVIVENIGRLADRRFAVIVDEAHSSQSGESTRKLKEVLSKESLEEAAAEEHDPDPDTLEDELVERMKRRGRLPNVSTFAFTATPKQKTLELFGTQRPDGQFEPFSLYSMRQAIEEGFILDVLENYTTFNTYWKLLKTIEDDPRYDRAKAQSLMKAFVDLHEHSIGQKVRIMVDHFESHVAHRIGGRAKAMIVTRSRLHCVRFKRALDAELAERKAPFGSLVAFSGTVEDGGIDYTEPAMNGLPESQTKAAFERPEMRFLVVANKFQTGFDQPLLHTMYVDKQLGGVNAVQTLSRLNRTHPGKTETMVLDFANDAEAIQKAFEPYYETTLLSEATDPNVLYDRQHELEEFAVFTQDDVDAFARLFFAKRPQDELYRALAPFKERAESTLDADQLADFRSKLGDYARQYAFLSQVIPFTDPDLEKLYAFAPLLRRYLATPSQELPKDVREKIDMDSLRIERSFTGQIALAPGNRALEPLGERDGHGVQPEEIEALSKIIQELNDRFGANLGPEDRITVSRLLDEAAEDDALRLAVQNNTEENARLAFETRLTDMLQEIVETNFQLYKRISDDRNFSDHLMTHLFDQFRRRIANGGLSEEKVLEQIARGETKHQELKATLRRNLHTGETDDRMTLAVLKTIAAFQNTEGGVLFIGVADDGTISGLEPDGFPNADKFLLHLNNVAKTALGSAATTRIDARIWTLGERQICRVECPPSPEPVFVRYKKTPETVYVRSGPSTEELSPSAMHGYAAERFRS